MKIIKRLLTTISVIVIAIMSSLFTIANADLLTLSYEVGTDEYIEYCNDMTKVSYEEKLGDLLNAGINQKWHNVYYVPLCNDETFVDEKTGDINYGNVNEYMIEIDDPDNTTEKDYRRFIGIKLYFNQLFEMDGEGGMLTNSIESINSFLKDNGYDAKVEINSLNEGGIDKLYITYGEKVDAEGMTDILHSLYKEFGLEPFTYITYGSIVVAGAALNEDPDKDENVVYGDADNDGFMNVRDCSFIAMKIASSEADSLPVSADFNSDEKVNVRDAAAIASYLANK